MKTRIVNGVQVLEFKDWLAIPEVKTDIVAKIDECPICEGKKKHECECGHKHDCEECGGTGLEQDPQNIYKAQLKVEVKKLLEWREKVIENARAVKP